MAFLRCRGIGVGVSGVAGELLFLIKFQLGVSSIWGVVGTGLRNSNGLESQPKTKPRERCSLGGVGSCAFADRSGELNTSGVSTFRCTTTVCGVSLLHGGDGGDEAMGLLVGVP